MEADLPNDVEALRALVLEQARELDMMNVFQAEVERLRAIIEALQRHRFGRRSEQLDPDQLELCLEEVEAALAAAEEARDKASRVSADRPRKTNRGSLPAHLERIEQVIDIDDKDCPCCGGALHSIGEDVTERLDVVPTTFRVLVTRRPRYGCRSCEGAIVQAPAPARIVEGGLPTEALIAQVLVSKQIRLAFCWAHVRRKFFELADNSPVATDVLRQIAALYAIENDIRGLPAEHRQAARSEQSRPIVEGLHRSLVARARQVSAKSRLADAIRYALTRWDGLSRFLDDGRIDLDNNAVERSIRPLALNRKNALFAGSDEGGDNWAVIATLIECCKLNAINPHDWLTATLSRLAAGHQANAVDKLMPWIDVG